MFTRDRINRILTERGLPIDNNSRPHDILDKLDHIAGVDTTGGLQYALFSSRKVPVYGVGSRTDMHERLVLHSAAVTKPPPLIDDACTCGHCLKATI